MTRTLACMLIAVVMSLPSLAQARAYKCQQANGKTSFQDHPCQAGTAGSSIHLVPAQGYSAADAQRSTGTSSSSTGKPSGDPRYPYARGDDVERMKAQNAELQAANARMKAENPEWQHSQTLKRLNDQAEALDSRINDDGKRKH